MSGDDHDPEPDPNPLHLQSTADPDQVADSHSDVPKIQIDPVSDRPEGEWLEIRVQDADGTYTSSGEVRHTVEPSIYDGSEDGPEPGDHPALNSDGSLPSQSDTVNKDLPPTQSESTMGESGSERVRSDSRSTVACKTVPVSSAVFVVTALESIG